MVQSFLNLIKWFACAIITLLICMLIVAPLALFAELIFGQVDIHPMIENGVYWTIGLGGLIAGMSLAVRFGFDAMSIPLGKVERDAE